MLRIGIEKRLFFWKRDKTLSKDLLKGVILALIFHLTLFLGLRIASPPNPDIFSVIVPVAVEVDLGTPQISLPHHIALSPILGMKPPPLLEIPSLTLEHPSFQSLPEADFSEIEKIDYELLEDLDD